MKKLLLVVGSIVILVVVAALIAPFLIPTETYKSRIIALVQQATGRELRIDGPVRLSFLPKLGVAAKDVSFANMAGAKDPAMLRLKEMEVELRLLPLLHGEVAIGRFVLTEPVISLEIDKSGRPNWAFAAAAPAPVPGRPAPGASPPAYGGGGISELHLDDVRLVSGTIAYRDDRTGKEEQLSDINVKLSLPDLDTPFAAEGSAVWHDQKMALSIGTQKPRALLGGGASAFSVRLEGKPVTLGFAGTITGLPPAKLDGTIDLAVPSVRDLATWAGAPLPPGGGLGTLAIKGKIAMAGPKIAFTDADVAIDAITAKGSIAVDTSGTRPALKGTLAVDKLDVNPYLPVEAAATPGKVPTTAPTGDQRAAPAAAGWSDAPIDTAGLAMVDADFDLKAGAILYRKIEIGDSALDLHLKDSKLAANLSRISLYHGQGTGKIGLDGSGAVPALTLGLNVTGVQVEPLLAAAASTDRLSGTGKISLDVAGSGKSQRALIGALNGKGAFELVNGQIKGVNLVALAENATSSLTGLNGNDKTDFGSLTGTYTIVNGIVHNDDLQLKSGIIPITGAGTINLPTRMVAYRVTVSLAGAIGVPVVVSGPWNNLSYHPDFAGALEGAAKTPGAALNALKSLGGKATGGDSSPTNMLKGLFGK